MKNLLLISATLTLSFNFLSVSNANQLDKQVNNNRQLDQESLLRGELSPDFNTCYIAIQDEHLTASSPQPLDSNLATNKFNHLSNEKNTSQSFNSHQTVPICN